MSGRKMKPKAIILDIDDVIGDFCGDLCWVHNMVNGTCVTANDIRGWNFETLKVSDRNGNEVIGSDLRETFRFWEEHGLYASLNIKPRVSEAIAVMRLFGYKVIFLTARDSRFREETKLNFWRNGIKFRDDELILREDDDKENFKTKKIKQLSKDYNIQMFVDDKYSTIEHVADNTNVNIVCLMETASTRNLKTIEGDKENRLEKNENIHKFVDLYDVTKLLKDLRPKEER